MNDDEHDKEFLALVNDYASALVSFVAIDDLDDHGPSQRLGVPNISRERVSVETIFTRLGERLLRKCYRMSESLFWRLHGLLRPHMKTVGARQRGAMPNGDITTSARLSMAIRWFAGGEAADIFQVHGVHYNEVYNSVWAIVDAVNLCPQLQLGFPADHEEQRRIAEGFRLKSRVSFSNCAGCIFPQALMDGVLLLVAETSLGFVQPHHRIMSTGCMLMYYF